MPKGKLRNPRLIAFVMLLSFRILEGQQFTEIPKPPVARIQPFTMEKFGNARIDNYYWLRERENPEVLNYLRSENTYTDAVMAHTAALQDTLFNEFKTRIKQTDISVPNRRGDYYYYTRMESGKDYPILCRKKGSMNENEEILLDGNELAKGHAYFSFGDAVLSKNQNLLAFSADTVGRRFYMIHVKNLITGEILQDVISNVTYNLTWANDDRTLFYTKQDPATLRWYRTYRHILGTDASRDQLVYQENDSTFSTTVSKTKTKQYILIASNQTLGTEYRFLDANHPEGEFRVFTPRRKNHEYSVDHCQDFFYIVTNDQAKNFRLMKTPVGHTERRYWQEVIPHRKDVLLEGIEIFKDYLVVTERKDGLIRMCIRQWSGDEPHYIDFGEPAYQAYVGVNHEFDTPVLRYEYTSLTTPNSVYDYDMVTRQKTLLKREEVLRGFDSGNYQAERLYAKAIDGARVPISLVYRKGMIRKDGNNPLLLYGYGSYGISRDATFSPFRISLLDRGFIYAIAHVRGGQELGRSWYEDGKLLKKKNTFTDFIDCATFLVQEKYTSPVKLFGQGGSAGGLLMGAVLNMRPDLFKGVIAAMPFVDVLTTQLDETIPLTTGEYDEWGNPNVKKYYRYILSYSPYDNVTPKPYPNILVLTGLQDSQVQYWEPAKWAAKLRALKTDRNLLLLKTEMEAGHGGVSGRDKEYRQTAFQYAFLLDLAGIDR